MDYKKAVALDTETAKIDRGADLAPPIACLTYCDNENYTPGITVGQDVLRVLREVVASDTKIVGANFAYDACVLLRAFPELTADMLALYDSDRIGDVQLNERLCDIAKGQLDGAYDPSTGKWVARYYSLSALHDRAGLGALEKGETTWRLRYGELIGTPLLFWPAEAKQYALDDAAATLRVYEAQQAHSYYFKDDSAAQARGAFALQKIAIRGMVTDANTCNAYIAELKDIVVKARKTLEDADIVRSNGSRDTKKAKSLMESVCAEHGLDVKKTATGATSLDQEACAAVTGLNEVLTAYNIFSTSDTLLTRAEQLLEGSKGLPLQTSFQSLLENGRVSSRIPKAPIIGVQQQNLPRKGKLRSCFVPRPGYVFASIDYAADEIACFAQCEIWLTGKSLMAEALRAGRDLHCEVAAAMLGESYETVLANKAHGKYKTARQFAKVIGFGSLGAMGAKTLHKHANAQAKSPEDRMTLRQAEEAHAAWLKRWQVQPFFDAVKSSLGQDSFNSVCTIRQFVSGRIRGALNYTAACNSLFSGLAADGNKDAMYRCVRASMLAKPGSPFFDTHCVAPLHDELIFELPESSASDSAKALCKLMLDTKAKWTPDVPVGAEPCLMRAWYKDASPVWAPDGELLVWNPPVEKKAA